MPCKACANRKKAFDVRNRLALIHVRVLDRFYRQRLQLSSTSLNEQNSEPVGKRRVIDAGVRIPNQAKVGPDSVDFVLQDGLAEQPTGQVGKHEHGGDHFLPANGAGAVSHAEDV